MGFEISAGAVLAFIGLLIFIYALYSIKEKNAIYALGLSLILIGAGLLLGIRIALTISASLLVGVSVIVVGAIILALPLLQKRVFYFIQRPNTSKRDHVY